MGKNQLNWIKIIRYIFLKINFNKIGTGLWVFKITYFSSVEDRTGRQVTKRLQEVVRGQLGPNHGCQFTKQLENKKKNPD